MTTGPGPGGRVPGPERDDATRGGGDPRLMDETTRAADRRRLANGLLVILAAALIYPAYHLTIAAQPDDTNHLETTLALVIERQVRDGPGTLYGPFTGRQPLVLIHAPLYYRLAAAGTRALGGLGGGPGGGGVARGGV